MANGFTHRQNHLSTDPDSFSQWLHPFSRSAVTVKCRLMQEKWHMFFIIILLCITTLNQPKLPRAQLEHVSLNRIEVDPICWPRTLRTHLSAHTRHHHMIFSMTDRMNVGQRRDTDPPPHTRIIHSTSLILFTSFTSADVSTSLSFSFLNASLLYTNQVYESWLNAATISPQLHQIQKREERKLRLLN